MSQDAVAPLLVLAVGNPSRGDDALGPALLDALAALAAQGADRLGDIELLSDFQLQIEHALDLQGRRAVLFVDAARPGVVAAAGGVALTPCAVLQVAQLVGGPVPPAWQLAIEGLDFGLGEPISSTARARLASALALVRGWIAARRGEAAATHAAGAAHA